MYVFVIDAYISEFVLMLGSALLHLALANSSQEKRCLYAICPYAHLTTGI